MYDPRLDLGRMKTIFSLFLIAFEILGGRFKGLDIGSQMARPNAGWLEVLETRRMLSAAVPQTAAFNGPLQASAPAVVEAASSAAPGTISGTVFNDINKDGLQNFSEPNLPNQNVWLDLNNDGKYEPNEPAVTTDATGAFIFTGVGNGTYIVRIYAPPGFHQTPPAPPPPKP